MSATDGEFLKISGITKTYGVVKALSDVSFSVRKGEIHTVLGENGAGKSTLVKIRATGQNYSWRKLRWLPIVPKRGIAKQSGPIDGRLVQTARA